MIACVPLLSVWHREVLWAEGWVGLAATNAAVRSANQNSSVFITVPLIEEEKQFPGCHVQLLCYNWPRLRVPTQPWVSLSPGAHCQPEKLQLLSGQVSACALTAQSKNELASQRSVTVWAQGTLFLTRSKGTRQLAFETYTTIQTLVVQWMPSGCYASLHRFPQQTSHLPFWSVPCRADFCTCTFNWHLQHNKNRACSLEQAAQAAQSCSPQQILLRQRMQYCLAAPPHWATGLILPENVFEQNSSLALEKALHQLSKSLFPP